MDEQPVNGPVSSPAEVEAPLHDTHAVGAAVEQARRRPRFWLWVVQGYLVAYLFIVALGWVLDTVLRSQLDTQQRDAVNTLAWVTTGLYALALVVLLVSFTVRLHLRHRRSKSIWLLFLGLAGLLVARGYFSASLLVPNFPQGSLSVVMSDVGLGAGTAIVLGMIWGVFDVAIYAARQARAQARRVRLPRLGRRSGAGSGDAHVEGTEGLTE